ncbi:class I SAM-dependent methyltransferase [Mycobacterium marseillense]|uniref:S-adenosyl-L-methionine-dependent methyltransferase n=1 Tax=Mycobacterium [tuberculosis] TKK-01-0051 TaxID=1324261 RepID=A0A051TW09_9MYCO|nr:MULTISPECIES: class I SAM-dependent methyltransferase [Mycobacterium avium complex (MAC)]KBZ61177.1 hypothetical protein K875_04128 [Mycobacterium [tuberculosis] TKK-01-0051]MDM3973388.1 class I SAM-dependent methyltransferase [Mycobacterium marseillense]
MARTDNDTWDIDESVGATALGVAGGRAAETKSADPLISDPYAKLFLEAAGDGIWRVYLDDELPAQLADADPQFEDRMQAMLGYTACRTKFFDDYFLAAAADGIRQVVILAAGLDSRAWRLAWPAGCVVYEIDQPKVLEFKIGTLESHAVDPIASHVSVGIDLRLDWPKALVQAGFDASAPTAWSAEGLLPYLTADAQDRLFDRIQSLSAPGAALPSKRSPTSSSARKVSGVARSRRNAIGRPQSSWAAKTSPSPATCFTKKNEPKSSIGCKRTAGPSRLRPPQRI